MSFIQIWNGIPNLHEMSYKKLFTAYRLSTFPYIIYHTLSKFLNQGRL